MNLNEWAARWQIPDAALAEFRAQVLAENPDDPRGKTGSEGAVSNGVRLEAAESGARLFRNNVGGAYMRDGGFLRYGLANDTKALNKRFKSSDLIGIRPRLITIDDVGKYVGQFCARECKRPGWTFTGTEREVGQLNFINFIIANGGDAGFVTGRGSF